MPSSKADGSEPRVRGSGAFAWFLDDLKQSLTGGRGSNLLVILAVGAGTFACSFLLGIQAGLEDRARQLVRDLRADTALIEVRREGRSLLTPEFLSGLRADFPGADVSGESVRSASVRGLGTVPILLADAYFPRTRAPGLREGRLLDPEDHRTSAPFAVLCSSLNLRPGDTLRVENHVLTVAGTAALEGQIWISDRAGLFPELRDAPFERMRLRSDRIPAVLDRLRQQGDGAELSVTTPELLLRETRRWQRLVLAGGGAVVALFFLLGGAALMSVMMLSVRQRRREIGLRMAMGARETDIFLLFVGEGLLLSLFAGLLGTGLALLAGWAAVLPPELPFLHPAATAWIPVLFSAVTGALFSCGPALHAAAQSPAVVLRGE